MLDPALLAASAGIPFPQIDPVAITIPAIFGFGPFPIRWYALAYIAGFLLGYWYVLRLIARTYLWAPAQARPNREQVGDYFFWAMVGVIVGGRLGYVLFYKPDMLWKDPLQVFALWEGGMAFHGGMIGVALAIWLFSRANKIPILTLGDLTAAAVPIGIFFGRIANFINGELWGRPANVPWAIVFPNAGPEPRHPSQLYQAALEGLLLFAVAWVLAHRFGALKRPGLVTGVFLAGYGIVRVLSEFVREPDRHMPDFPLGLTMGMLLSLPMIAAGVGLIAWSRRKAAA